ncbi:Clp protease ClpP [Desulfosporosinus fructosivorans]|uniref:Clp protease ClpP n=1 Tax=Desulfosporosinus fructosivorans TaxID=2018669 RepID=A0A4Z0R313_9FIRM|nr:head maturation protease, ClpP-related [Desulfosporosinus fructosivorans]TGE36879.1 Clp protease ClpP [Desulfosporosinus fructosivorans]
MSRFWQFIRNQASGTTPENIELRIEGNIVDSEDAWLYEWFGIPAASPNAFRIELAQYAGKDITLWVDSYGGSVFAATGMYIALIEHKQTGAKITGKVGSKAMSAGTIPLMACDEILMSLVAIMMVHNPLSSIQGYASDMRKAADVLDIIKDTIINAYANKTGKPRDVISAMMDDETYMSANVAVKEGFADGVLYQENGKPENIMNFAYNRITIQNSANESIRHLFALVDSSVIPVKNSKEEEFIVDLAELKEKYPDIYNSAINEGTLVVVKAERERIKAFDVLNGKVDADFLANAKYVEGATAENVLFKAMQEGKIINAAYVTSAEADAETANAVPGDASDDAKPDEVTGILNKVTAIAKRTLGIQEGGK